MTAFLNPLRLCLRTARQAPVLRGNRLAASAIKTSFHPASRRLATSEAHDDAIEEDDDGDGHDGYSDDNLGEILAEISRDPTLSDEERKEVTAALRTYKDASKAEHRQRQEQRDGSLGDDSLGDDLLGDVSLGVNDMVEDFTHDLDPLRRPVKPKRDTFWHEDETDEDLITDEIGEDEFDEDDILSMAHGKLEEHREAREYARVAVWEMPLLSSASMVSNLVRRIWKLTVGDRACEALRAALSGPTLALQVHVIHGRVSSRRAQGGGRVQSQRLAVEQ